MQSEESCRGNNPPPHDSSAPPLILESHDLLSGRREVWIRHGDEMYRLRLTSAGKLYLTK
ncbi:MAG: hemin uptake protein HemP [Pirellulaceae bacterium]